MRVAILGATGGTGRAAVDAALTAGHTVTVLARDPDAFGARPGLTVVRGSVPGGVATAVAGADVVISALGSRDGRRPTTVLSDGVRAALTGGARRIVAVSAVPAGPDEGKSVLERRLVHPLLGLFFGGSYDDMRRMEEVLAAGGAAWTVLRPPRLTNAPATGRYRVDRARLPRARSISRADLAAALLDAATDDGVSGVLEIAY